MDERKAAAEKQKALRAAAIKMMRKTEHEREAGHRGRRAVSGLKKSPTKSDDERFRAKRAIEYKRKFKKAGY